MSIIQKDCFKFNKSNENGLKLRLCPIINHIRAIISLLIREGGYMYIKKYFLCSLLVSVLLFFSACTPKIAPDLSSQSIEKTASSAAMDSEQQTLHQIESQMNKQCNAQKRLNNLEAPTDDILLEAYKNYLFVDLNNIDDFEPSSYTLTPNAIQKLRCIAPILKAQDELFIQITGHTDSSGNASANQHLSDNRAITVAEMLFNEEVKHEIFVKGCSDKKPKMNAIFGDDASANRRVEIYIYVNKSNLLDHCK